MYFVYTNTVPLCPLTEVGRFDCFNETQTEGATKQFIKSAIVALYSFDSDVE